MRHYDAEKVEALLDQMDADVGCGYLIHSLAAAVRSSAREVEQPSEEEIERLVRQTFKEIASPWAFSDQAEGHEETAQEFASECVRAALARFGQQGGIVQG